MYCILDVQCKVRVKMKMVDLLPYEVSFLMRLMQLMLVEVDFVLINGNCYHDGGRAHSMKLGKLGITSSR